MKLCHFLFEYKCPYTELQGNFLEGGKKLALASLLSIFKLSAHPSFKFLRDKKLALQQPFIIQIVFLKPCLILNVPPLKLPLDLSASAFKNGIGATTIQQACEWNTGRSGPKAVIRRRIRLYLNEIRWRFLMDFKMACAFYVTANRWLRTTSTSHNGS